MLTLRGRAAPPGGIIPAVHNILAVPPTNQEGFKGTSSLRDGVSTYLALTFGTLLSSQGTEASIEAHHRPLRAYPPMFPTLSDFSGRNFPPHCSRTRVSAALVEAVVITDLCAGAG